MIRTFHLASTFYAGGLVLTIATPIALGGLLVEMFASRVLKRKD